MTDYLLAILSLFYSEVKFAQSCLTLCDPMDCTVHGILLARILEWVFPFSRGPSQPRDWTQVSRIADGFFTSWATREAEEYWSAWPIPSPADLPDPGIEPESPALQVDSLPTELWHLLNIYHVLNSDCKAREEGGSIWAASGGKCRLLVDDQIERCP